MNGAISVIDQLFRMPEGEAGAAAFVTRVGARGGITFAKARGESVGGDGAQPRPIAHSLEFSIPSCGGQPDFNLDIRIAAGLDRRCDAAKCRKVREGIR